MFASPKSMRVGGGFAAFYVIAGSVLSYAYVKAQEALRMFSQILCGNFFF